MCMTFVLIVNVLSLFSKGAGRYNFLFIFVRNIIVKYFASGIIDKKAFSQIREDYSNIF